MASHASRSESPPEMVEVEEADGAWIWSPSTESIWVEERLAWHLKDLG